MNVTTYKNGIGYGFEISDGEMIFRQDFAPNTNFELMTQAEAETIGAQLAADYERDMEETLELLAQQKTTEEELNII